MTEKANNYEIEHINEERRRHEEAMRLMYERHIGGYALSEADKNAVKQRVYIENNFKIDQTM